MELTLVQSLFFYVLKEELFPAKKNKLKYENKSVDIIESVIEHNTGVLYNYHNNTKNLKLNINLVFKRLDNLKFDKEQIEEIGDKFDNNTNALNWTLEPGSSQLFKLICFDKYNEYSYDVDTSYEIQVIRKRNSIL